MYMAKMSGIEAQDGQELVEIQPTICLINGKNEPLASQPVTGEGEENKKIRILWLVTLFSSVDGVLYGYNFGVIAGALLALANDFPLDTTKKELLVSVVVGAAAIGALVGGPLNEMFGRKKTIMLGVLVSMAGIVLAVGAPLTDWGWTIVLTGRFLVGIHIGMASMTVPLYLAECVPTNLRGKLNVTYNISISGGQLVAAVCTYGLSYAAQGWRYMFGLAAIPALVLFIAFFFLPESPRWLVGKGRVEAAQRVLVKLRAGDSDEAEKELREIKTDLEQSAQDNSRNILHKLKVILSTRHLLFALTVGCGLQVIQQFSGINTVVFYSPLMLRMAGVVDDHLAIGLGAVVSFIKVVFGLIGIYFVERSGRRKLILASLAGIVLSLIVLGLAFYLANISSPAAFAPVDVFSECRLNSNICGIRQNCDECVVTDDCRYCTFNGSFNSENTVGLCVSLDDPYLHSGGECSNPDSLTVNYTSYPANTQCHSMDTQNMTVSTFQYCPSPYAWMTMAAMITYVLAFAPGMGPVPWTVNAEIYPNWARSIGCSIATTINWLSNLLVSVTFLHLTQYLTRYGAFWLYAGIASAGWVFIFLLLPETKGKALEQVEELFQKPLCPPPGFSSACGGMCCRSNAYFIRVETTPPDT